MGGTSNILQLWDDPIHFTTSGVEVASHTRFRVKNFQKYTVYKLNDIKTNVFLPQVGSEHRRRVQLVNMNNNDDDDYKKVDQEE